MRKLVCLPWLWLVASMSAFSQEGTQQLASLGNFKLESGEIIRDCHVGYRLYGHLNAKQSNAILFPTWFGGTSRELEDYFGPGKLVDTSLYYVIGVDALANGVSSSPSNSPQQPHLKFPRISIRDMVNSQYQLLSEKLRIPHLKAVIGDSMGGMQTFQWMVSYPDFLDYAIPIVGSPRLNSYELTLFQLQVDAIRNDPAWNHGEYTEQPAVTTIAEAEALTLTTPGNYNHEVSREKFRDAIEESKKDVAKIDANNRIRQAEAMMAHDVSAPYGGSMEGAAARVRAKVLVIIDVHDHMVTPQAAVDFARLLHARVISLESDCGHTGPECDMKDVAPQVAAFLSR
ncbi:MAG TPA: alpha/beta fold hydrolase [Terriglobales bacterium]|nr:alpha/beta fold hydrolase [Terriglobales bacterium]